jgi:prevent-host-death family protein
MNSYPLAKARSSLSKLVDQALAGEPQRITRHGKEAVVLVSEAEWEARQPKRETLADLFLRTVGKGEADDLFGDRSWYKDERPLGIDFSD